jgi:NAD(P)-dependent dehydrogenase (short-subunit alcohol dehydrogenase family)
MSSFAGQVVLITGAASGIGRQFARVLAGEGARLALLDRQKELLDDLALELKACSIAHAVADVTDRAALVAAVRDLEERLGPTDMLIANAGIFRETPADGEWVDDFTAQIQTNLLGVAHSIEAVLPGMRARRRGHIVAVSSIASYRGLPAFAGYSASKAGVNALCDAFRVELRPFGIAVTTLCPGFVKTNIGAHMDQTNAPPMISVEDAVGRMMAAIRRRRVFYTFPARDAWKVRLLRYLPRAVSDWMLCRALRRYRQGRRVPDSPA